MLGFSGMGQTLIQLPSFNEIMEKLKVHIVDQILAKSGGKPKSKNTTSLGSSHHHQKKPVLDGISDIFKEPEVTLPENNT
jgi:hypothetical protein